ncbi:MAG: metalloregulator ArsR/SmtB family transcription factor [archaeon]
MTPDDICGYKCMNVLGNELRCKIIRSLKDNPMTVTELCKTTTSEQSRLSHSLKQLRECNFVGVSKRGKERVYSLKSDLFTKKIDGTLFDAMKGHIEKHCMDKLKPKKGGEKKSLLERAKP